MQTYALGQTPGHKRLEQASPLPIPSALKANDGAQEAITPVGPITAAGAGSEANKPTTEKVSGFARMSNESRKI